MLKNPAYQGSAAFGKTRTGPRRPQLRTHRGQTKTPRRTGSTYDTEPSEQIAIPVPAIVSEELFDAVQATVDREPLARPRTKTWCALSATRLAGMRMLWLCVLRQEGQPQQRQRENSLRVLSLCRYGRVSLRWPSVSARTNKFAPTNSTKPCGTMRANCCAIPRCCGRSTSDDWLHRGAQTVSSR